MFICLWKTKLPCTEFQSNQWKVVSFPSIIIDKIGNIHSNRT
ncbi:unnamed protein product [Brassica oleracea]